MTFFAARFYTRRRTMTGVIAALFATLAASAAPAQSFHALGFLPGDTKSIANAVSADGLTVVGWSWDDFNHQHAFRWTQAEGMKDLGILPGGDSAYATGVSADGSVIVGSSTSATTIADDYLLYEGFRWTKTGGMVSLGFPVNAAYRSSGANGVSADGTAIVGSTFSAEGLPNAYRWTRTGGFTVIPETDSGWAISADGTVIAGGNSFSAFRWTMQNGLTVIDPKGAIGATVAYGMSPDGKSLVGEDAYLWSETAGYTFLHSLPGGESVSWELGISNAGVVVGWSSVGYTSEGGWDLRAILWDRVNGMRNLKTVLTGYGLNLSGWTLREVRAITPDGRTIVGYGDNPQGKWEAWVATLPRHLPSIHSYVPTIRR